MLFKELPDLEEIEMKLSELHYMELLYETRQSIAAKDVNLIY